jgi:hypothetical protein
VPPYKAPVVRTRRRRNPPARSQQRPPQQVVRQRAVRQAGAPARRQQRQAQARAVRAAPSYVKRAAPGIAKRARQENRKVIRRARQNDRGQHDRQLRKITEANHGPILVRVPSQGSDPVAYTGPRQTIGQEFANSPFAKYIVRAAINPDYKQPRYHGRRGRTLHPQPGFVAGGSGRSALDVAVEGGIAKVRKPVVKAGLFTLKQTTRPIHGIAGAAYAGVKGENILRGAGRGFALKDHRLFSDVLGAAGVKNKAVRGIVGTVLDIGFDPTTYATGGASVAAKGLTKAAERKVVKDTTVKALKAGASPQEAAHASRVAVALAHRESRATRGVTVGLRAMGKEVKTSGKATRAIARKTHAGKAGQRVREAKPVQIAGELLRPEFRPKGVPREEWERVRHAERTARATRAAGHRAAQDRAVAYHRALKGKDHAEIIHAVETGTTLPDPAKQQVVDAVRADLAHAHGAELRQGLIGGKLEGYFPHKLKGKLLPGGKKLPAGKRAELESSRQRTKRLTLADLKTQGYDEFSTDVPLVMGARLSQSATARANAHLISELNSAGRPFGLGATRKEGEAVYEISKRRPPRKLSKDELNTLHADLRELGPRDAFKGREFKVLNDKLVEHATRTFVPPKGAVREFGRWYDRALQGRFKTLVTVPNPQYHLTNLYGDVFNAYLGDTRFLTGTAGVHSARALGRLGRREKARRELSRQLDPTSKGLRIKGRKVTYDALLDEAEKVGAIRTGFIGRDLPEVLDAQAKELAERVGQGRVARKIPGGSRVATSRAGRAATHPIDTIRNVGQYREDFVRLATYIEGRKRGMSPAEAAQHVSRYHFDYGDLTDFERTVLRRVFPFYTFTARNTPLQVKTLLTRPGKYANFEKVREESQKYMELPQDYEARLTDYQQRGIPIPIPGRRDKNGNPQLLFPKLPLTDLGRLAPDLSEQEQYITQMVSPLILTPIEFPANYSFFFREPIDRLYAKSKGKVQDYVPAPQWLGATVKTIFGESGLRKLGLRKAPASKTDRTVAWVWPKRVNYLYGHLGPAAATAQRLGAPENRVGQGSEEAAFGFLTGLKVAPYDTKRIKTDAQWDERNRLDSLAELMRKDGRKGTAQYRKVQAKLSRLNKNLYGTPARSSGAWGSAGGSKTNSGGWGTAGTK